MKIGEPSPFSRRGPGANYMVKPDLADFGGNLNNSGTCNDLGNFGIGLDGFICEGIGTSYSTPLTTYKYAKIYEQLTSNDLLLAKGLLIHDAKINNRLLNIKDEQIKYYGFGQPSINCEEVLNCSENEITLIFKQKVRQGTHLSMEDFPYPKCLCENRKYKGEIFMTLIYNPLLNHNYGAEYCRINFDASFGTYNNDLEGKPIFKGQVPLEKNWDGMYEGSRVANGFKWSPIKSYHRNLKNGIGIADGWKIRVDMNARNNMSVNPQEFLLIITIRGNEDSPVYNDVVQELKNKGYLTINLETKQQVRGRN